MIKVKILTIGKTKEKWLDDALDEYIKRMKPSLTLEWNLLKNDQQLIDSALKEPSFICLDVQGRLLSSEEFAQFFHLTIEKNGSRLCLIIGGAEGLPEKLKQKADALISLSPLTFTHQITRLVLIEQIYRALEIKKGSSYHKV